MTNLDHPSPLDMNPYQPPKSMPQHKPPGCKHVNFRLTIDEIHENGFFVIGKISDAVIFSFMQQLMWVMIISSVVSGTMLTTAGIAVAVFWLMVVATAIAQRGHFSDQQTLAVKWGYMPVFLIVANIQHLFEVIGSKYW